MGVIVVWIVTALNSMGTKWGTVVNNVFTLLKLIALAAVAIIGIVVLGMVLLCEANRSNWAWSGEFQSEFI